MTPATAPIVIATAKVCLAALSLAFVLTIARLIRGPSLADRVVALDLMTAIGVGIIGVDSILSGESAMMDAAVIVALITFLGTIAFARYLERGGLK